MLQSFETCNKVVAEILHDWAGDGWQEVTRLYLERCSRVLDANLFPVSQLIFYFTASRQSLWSQEKRFQDDGLFRPCVLEHVVGCMS